jgi:hypothetical protein
MLGERQAARGSHFWWWTAWWLGVGAAAAGSSAAELLVPAQYATIQAAIDAAQNGDTVIVADGVYSGSGNRDIDFLGKAITVRSANGPTNCIVHCAPGYHRGFRFHLGEGPQSVLDGLTIQYGMAPEEPECYASGGGILCRDGSRPTIRNCILRHNWANF